MISKIAIPKRTIQITESERQAAKEAIHGFKKFLGALWSAQQHDKRLINILNKAGDVDPSSLFEIRHLIRKFQKETKEIYTDLIIMFAGKRDQNMNNVSQGVISLLTPLEKDTITRQIKIILQDAMQQLIEFVEEYLEALEDFNSVDQIEDIKFTAKKSEQLAQNIENIIEKQMRVHFERNILGRPKTSSIRQDIKKRTRLINLMRTK